MINAWHDPWLPLHPPRPPQPSGMNTEILMVKDLINATCSGWNEHKVRELIAEEDVGTVLSIKVASKATQDLLEWHYTIDGLYTVKSAYWLSIYPSSNQGINHSPGSLHVKKLIWKLKTAPKIKHFLWKLLSGALATGKP